MKLVQINICDFGSTGRIMRQIHDTATKNGIESWCFYGKGKQSEENNRMIKFSTPLDYYSHVFAGLVFDRYGFGSKWDTQRLIEYLKDIKPDIIHLHNIHSFVLNLEMLFEYIKYSNIKVVWTLHDSWSFTAFCGNPEFHNCEKWKYECSNCPHRLSKQGRKRRSIFYDYSRTAFRRKKNAFCDVNNISIVSPSNWLKKNVEQSYLNYGELKTIHNGVDLDVFNPNVIEIPEGKNEIRRNYGIPTDCNLLLGVASVWTDAKGLNTFFQMGKMINDNTKILLVGLNDSQMKSLPENIIGVKRIENVVDLAKLYAISDVFINPTLADTFPTVNMESLACGTPVVTYNTNGSPESVGEGCGYVVEQGNTKILLEMAKKAISSCDREVCRRYAEKSFDFNTTIEKYFNLYKEKLKNINKN